jgi:hypothetical protein
MDWGLYHVDGRQPTHLIMTASSNFLNKAEEEMGTLLWNAYKTITGDWQRPLACKKCVDAAICVPYDPDRFSTIVRQI